MSQRSFLTPILSSAYTQLLFIICELLDKRAEEALIDDTDSKDIFIREIDARSLFLLTSCRP